MHMLRVSEWLPRRKSDSFSSHVNWRPRESWSQRDPTDGQFNLFIIFPHEPFSEKIVHSYRERVDYGRLLCDINILALLLPLPKDLPKSFKKDNYSCTYFCYSYTEKHTSSLRLTVHVLERFIDFIFFSVSQQMAIFPIDQ